MPDTLRPVTLDEVPVLAQVAAKAGRAPIETSAFDPIVVGG